MDLRRIALGLSCAVALSAGPVAAQPAADEPLYGFTANTTTLEVRGVGPIEALEGAIRVPENRANPSSRSITVRFVVLPAQGPIERAPVVYLAGGPGGAATAAASGARWPLFDALRQSGDVILLDQRGTGRSDAPPPCQSSVGWADGDPADRASVIARYRAAFAECEAFWTDQGVDLRGYNTAENAADVAAVSEVLRTRVHLLGISYGAHLAMAVMRAHPQAVDRVVLVGVEGRDDTVKPPADTDAYFARLQAWIDADPQARWPHGDVAAMVRRAAERLDAAPQPALFSMGDGAPDQTRVIDGFFLRALVGFSIADPNDRLRAALEVVHAVDQGDMAALRPFGALLPERIRLQPMATMMDLASGVSATRAALVASQAETALLGDALNFPLPHLAEESARYALPEAFRAPVRSTAPTLAFSGALDGRTYPAAAAEAIALMPAASHVIVENGGHNLFFDHPEVTPLIARFLTANPVRSQTLTAAQ